MMLQKITSWFILLFLFPSFAHASIQQSMLATYGLHIMQLLMLTMLLVMLLRKSVTHQSRLNWFFGAICLLFIASNLQVYQRFFASPGSVLYYAHNLMVLFVYFVVYWIKTWSNKNE